MVKAYAMAHHIVTHYNTFFVDLLIKHILLGWSFSTNKFKLVISNTGEQQSIISCTAAPSVSQPVVCHRNLLGSLYAVP